MATQSRILIIVSIVVVLATSCSNGNHKGTNTKYAFICVQDPLYLIKIDGGYPSSSHIEVPPGSHKIEIGYSGSPWKHQQPAIFNLNLKAKMYVFSGDMFFSKEKGRLVWNAEFKQLKDDEVEFQITSDRGKEYFFKENGQWKLLRCSEGHGASPIDQEVPAPAPAPPAPPRF